MKLLLVREIEEVLDLACVLLAEVRTSTPSGQAGAGISGGRSMPMSQTSHAFE